MMARIAMVRALQAGELQPVSEPGRQEIPDSQLKANHHEAMSHPVWPQLIPDIRSGVFPAFLTERGFL
jgi:hypothetical protein